MPFYRNYYNYYPRWRKWRRFPFRRRRPKKTFRRRKRRQRTVRRKKYFLKKRKLKTIKIQQWQPTSIKKCHIKGMLTAFCCGDGRQENNYTMYRDSWTPDHYPGGGGWAIHQISLGILYKMNKDLENIWTKSNYRLNMCRYNGCTLRCYRQPYTDWILHYFWDKPKNVTKYYYCSFHPSRLLQLQHKKVIPSFYSQPHRKKSYIKVKVKPPKLMLNHWYFQRDFTDTPLIHLACSALSLTNMCISDRSINENCTIHSLNAGFYQNPYFQVKVTTSNWGYHPNSGAYLWGIDHAKPTFTNNQKNQLIYLGNTGLNEPGYPAQSNTKNTIGAWGNPFHFHYLTEHTPECITTATQDPGTYMTGNLSDTLLPTQKKNSDNILNMRYNPHKDKGQGNRVYFVPNNSPSHTTWEPTGDPDLLFENFPLWILLWGIEDIVTRMGKCKNLNEDWVLVIQCRYLSEKENYIIPLSDNFVHGQGPYETDADHITDKDYTSWYPKFKFQKEAIHNIITTGPAVIRPDHSKSFQALIHYDFSFKWGGNPSPMESVYDPNSQPSTFTNSLNTSNEITDPATPIESFIYPWDCRRDFLTTKATKRITDCSITDQTLFKSTTGAATDFQPWTPFPQEEKTPQKEDQTLLLQLKQLQQYNHQIRQRLNRLNISLEDL
uniref:Capsid protein n=1 Tax=Betatorquevirus homini36 TaxID=3052022 RepID=A0AAU7STI6_9VIRU